MKKNDVKKFGFTRKILDDFQGFTVVVVTFFVEILDDFHAFVSECVSFPKIQPTVVVAVVIVVCLFVRSYVRWLVCLFVCSFLCLMSEKDGSSVFFFLLTPPRTFSNRCTLLPSLMLDSHHHVPFPQHVAFDGHAHAIIVRTYLASDLRPDAPLSSHLVSHPRCLSCCCDDNQHHFVIGLLWFLFAWPPPLQHLCSFTPPSVFLLCFLVTDSLLDLHWLR